ncbi:MAG TPA: tyrosine-type recombinase/integrase [Blastocatellia bacterium]|nr:tyrosine-type recombinase/integrase [Blastocatellia bacterium]
MVRQNKDSIPSSIAAADQQFDHRLANDFYDKSLSEHTRRAYRRIVNEFFAAFKNRHPAEILPKQVLAWRDSLLKKRQRPNTVAFKLAVVRSFYEYLRSSGVVTLNPAATRLVPPPELPEELAGRALTPEEARRLLAGPDRSRTDGARDYALLLVCLRLSLRVSEVCSLRASQLKWSHGRWIIKVKVKGGRERTLPVPNEVRAAIKEYLKLDGNRRRNLRCDGENAYLFQPLVNWRTLEFDRALSTRMAWNIVARWGDFCGLGKLSPHDLRRTAITRALDKGLSYRQVQMMSGHKDPKTVTRYDHGRDNLDQNAVNFLDYDE